MNSKKQFSSNIESMLLKFCIIAVVALISIQVLKIKDDTAVFTHDDITGVSSQSGSIILKKLDKGYNNIEVIVNSDARYTFNDDNELTIKVLNNDLIEIDGSMYKEKINIKLVGITKNIKQPNLNSVVTTDKSMETLGNVELEEEN